MTEYIEVHTTIDSREEAHKIAESIVFKHLAACVQVSGPITAFIVVLQMDHPQTQEGCQVD